VPGRSERPYLGLFRATRQVGSLNEVGRSLNRLSVLQTYF